MNPTGFVAWLESSCPYFNGGRCRHCHPRAACPRGQVEIVGGWRKAAQVLADGECKCLISTTAGHGAIGTPGATDPVTPAGSASPALGATEGRSGDVGRQARPPHLGSPGRDLGGWCWNDY